MKNFWINLPRPIITLAPMEDVTDTVFRQIVRECGSPQVFFTEFTNSDGMFSKGDHEVSKRLRFDPIEKPIVAQIWGLVPENFYKAAIRLKGMGYDGIDINMGCPEKSVISKGACSALINNHNLAREIIQATKEGAGELPVSVKTRLGFDKIQIEDWLGFLLSCDIAVLTVHARTAREMSKVPAHWDQMSNVVKLRDMMQKNTLIFGNGDIKSLEEAYQKVKQYGIDGVMIGRGIFENPWIFNPAVDITTISPKERMELLVRHVRLYEKIWSNTKPFQVLKKYFKIYIKDFDGASHLRQKLMECNGYEDVYNFITSHTIDNQPIVEL